MTMGIAVTVTVLTIMVVCCMVGLVHIAYMATKGVIRVVRYIHK